jgi:tetratricopeptide (TPR) repeat protein
LEKAIEIKRRAQRCVQNGDVDGALREYEKLVETPESDPYNFVLLADLLYKKGDQAKAAERYLNAVSAYEKAGLYKNAIAVCKKMSRLSLSPSLVLRQLADLHALDGLASEASLYYAQYAEHMLRANNVAEAVVSLRKAFDHGQENVKLLEQLSEVLLLEGHTAKSAEAMREAAQHWKTRGQAADARRCLARANLIDPASAQGTDVDVPAPTVLEVPGAGGTGEGLELVGLPPPDEAPAVAPEAVAPTGPAAEAPRGVLSGSRIPGVTAPSAPAVEPARAEPLALESRPGFKPGPVEPARMDGLTTGPEAGQRHAQPPADSAVFERPRSFAAPASGTPAGPPAVAQAAASQAHDTPSEAAPVPPDEEDLTPAEGVYEIDPGGESGYEAALREAQQAERSATNGPAPTSEPGHDPSPSTIARRPSHHLGAVGKVETLLQRAQDEFRAGNREQASQALVEAALAYERLGRLDSAATIFRSLGRGASAPTAVLELWLANCEKRGDRQEGSQVACELGDRSLNEGHENLARRWFEHAVGIDSANDTARRRLLRLTARPAAAPGPSSPSAPEAGRVAVAVGRGQAVTFDLQGLLNEFQRGVESQLEGDAQGHYDLGMAYREMGLHSEALAAFRIAERDARLTLRAREMCGRCLADAGRHDEAVREFEGALRFHTLEAEAEAELRFRLALSLAESHELADAVAQLEIADMRFPGRPDIVERLAEWRRAFGQAA